jgi:hypothetical protein
VVNKSAEWFGPISLLRESGEESGSPNSMRFRRTMKQCKLITKRRQFNGLTLSNAAVRCLQGSRRGPQVMLGIWPSLTLGFHDRLSTRFLNVRGSSCRNWGWVRSADITAHCARRRGRSAFAHSLPGRIEREINTTQTDGGSFGAFGRKQTSGTREKRDTCCVPLLCGLYLHK